MKKVKFYTFGCKSNQYDTQLLRESFLGRGFEESQNGLADAYVVNTCVVTKKAENGSLSLIKKIKKKYPAAEVIVKGCLNRYRSFMDKNIIEYPQIRESKIAFFAGHRRAFLKIQDGCDNFCSYCIVPYTRGRSRSKPQDMVKEEFRRLIENGYKEIVITGICLGDYGKDLSPGANLTKLIRELEKQDGRFRIRLSSIDPQYIDSDLLDILRDSDKLCPHLHIPFQSGDDGILKAMRRRYNSKFAFELTERIRRKIPDVSITTDVIVGFPQEGEANFLKTVKFLEFLKPLKVHIFTFSPRPPTPAAKLARTVGAEECKRRYAVINSLQQNWRRNFMERFRGKRVSVLAEERLSKEKNIFSGYSEYYFKTVFPAAGDCLNNFISVEVVGIRDGVFLCTL